MSGTDPAADPGRACALAALIEADLRLQEDEFAKLLGQHAAGGDLGLLRSALEHGLPRHRYATVRRAAFLRLLPLLNIPEEHPNGQSARQLLADWRTALGIDQRCLHGCINAAFDTTTLGLLLRAGADPNERDALSMRQPSGRTVLGRKLVDRSLAEVCLMLDHLADRDILPLVRAGMMPGAQRTLFAELIDAGSMDEHATAQHVFDHLAARAALPSAWAGAIGQAILERALQLGLAFSHFSNPTELRALALARFGRADEWHALFNACKNPCHIGNALAAADQQEGHALAALRVMLADGVRADEIDASFKADTVYYAPLLQAAVFHGATNLVECLLGHGADPRVPNRAAPGAPAGTYAGMDSFALAQRAGRTEMSQMLHAWRAPCDAPGSCGRRAVRRGAISRSCGAHRLTRVTSLLYIPNHRNKPFRYRLARHRWRRPFQRGSLCQLACSWRYLS